MTGNTEIDHVKNIFKHVSIQVFVKYFEVFRRNKDLRENSDIYAAFEANDEQWTVSSKRSRASKGKAIFLQKKEIPALEYIVKFAQNIRHSDETIEKARALLDSYK